LDPHQPAAGVMIFVMRVQEERPDSPDADQGATGVLLS
jgi:hypothetical protein